MLRTAAQHLTAKTTLTIVLVLTGCGGAGTATPDAGLTDAATAIADPTMWLATGDLLHARAHATATRLGNGKVLIAGGDDDHYAQLASCELYDPASGTFVEAAPLPSPRAFHTASLLADGRVLIVGGGPGSQIALPNGQAPTASALLYDPAQDRWTPTGDLHAARAGHQAAVLGDNRVLITGGGSGVGPACAASYPNCTIAVSVSSSEIYDPAAGMFSTTGDLTQPRIAFTLVSLPSGKLLAAGGAADNQSLSTAETYDTSTGKWAGTGAMSAKRFYQAATLLGDGHVLVVGGKLANVAPLKENERYDEGAGAWQPVPSLPAPRTGGVALTLPSGHGVVIAGFDQIGSAFLDDAQVYDAAAEAWTATSPLANGRYGHTATLLADGSILVAGGLGATGLLSSAERSR